MSIFRPREAVSRCEEQIAHCTRISTFFGTGDSAKFWRDQAWQYSRRRQTLIVKYGIKCNPVSLQDRVGDQP